MRLTSVGSAGSETERQEQAVGILGIALERAAEDEAVCLVERMRRLEIVPRAGLKTEPPQAAHAGLGDGVTQHLAAKAAPPGGLKRVH